MGSSDWRQAKKKGTIPWDRDSPRVRGGQIDHVGGGGGRGREDGRIISVIFFSWSIFGKIF